VRSLEIIQSYMDIIMLAEILRIPASLKELTYSHCNLNWRRFILVAAFLGNAISPLQGSLERLLVSNPNHRTLSGTIGTLQAFRRLVWLGCALRMLVEPEGALAKVLPTNLEVIHLEVHDLREVDQIIRLLEMKEECVPLLKEVKVYYMNPKKIRNPQLPRTAERVMGVKLIEVEGPLNV
jgi:hypothetical protein